MRNRCIIAGLVFALSISAAQASAQRQFARIPRSQIDAMFADMKAHSPWDLSGNLLWGYYFTSNSKAALESAAKLLMEQGYSFVDIRLMQPAPGIDGADWQLHVERVEHHTADTLFSRNGELYAFARDHGLASYDGMDVGPAK